MFVKKFQEILKIIWFFLYLDLNKRSSSSTSTLPLLTQFFKLYDPFYFILICQIIA